MPACDLCGREMRKLIRTELEGAELNVCDGCGKYGTILNKVEEKRLSSENFNGLETSKKSQSKEVVLPKKRIVVKEEIEERVVFDFSEKIRRARESKGMKQEEFANFLNEKWSLVQKWEGGSLSPDINLARKLEKILGINLVEKPKEKTEGTAELKKAKSGELTLADIIKIRRK